MAPPIRRTLPARSVQRVPTALGIGFGLETRASGALIALIANDRREPGEEHWRALSSGRRRVHHIRIHAHEADRSKIRFGGGQVGLNPNHRVGRLRPITLRPSGPGRSAIVPHRLLSGWAALGFAVSDSSIPRLTRDPDRSRHDVRRLRRTFATGISPVWL